MDVGYPDGVQQVEVGDPGQDAIAYKYGSPNDWLFHIWDDGSGCQQGMGQSDHERLLSQTPGKDTFGKVILVQEKASGCYYATEILRKKVTIAKDEVAPHTHWELVLQNTMHPFLTILNYAFQTSWWRGWAILHLSWEQVFTEYQYRFYGTEIVSALEYLNSKNVVYYDIKLENLILDKIGHIKITDFGLCIEGISDGTTMKTFCGTPSSWHLRSRKTMTTVVQWTGGAGMWSCRIWCVAACLYNQDLEHLIEAIFMEEIYFPEMLG